MCVALVSSCTLDFSQFDESASNVGSDVRAPDMSDFEVGGNDIGADVTVEPDATSTGASIGESCVENADCAEALCAAGLCTLGCASDAECPTNLLCGTFNGAAVCLPGCVEGCDTGRACTDVRGVGTTRVAVCLPDGDADGAADLFDSCVDAPNPTQADLDGDGLGDACDPDVACADGHIDGVLNLGPIAYAAASPALPHYAEGWILGAGGVDAGSAVVDLLASFDVGQATASTLPYAARAFGLAQLGSDEYLLTPGDLGADGQFGRFLIVDRDGTTRQGAPFRPAAYEPILATGLNREVWRLSYSGRLTSRYSVGRFDEVSGSFIEVVGGNDGARTQWRATRDIEGRIHFYSTPLDAVTGQARWITVGPEADAVSVSSVFYPDVGGDFDPLVSPAPGGYYVWDRNTGSGFTYRQGVFTAVPELGITNELLAASWISQPSGPGLHLVGGSAADPEMLQARTVSIACMPAVAAWDSDSDGVIDPRDLCPDDPLATDADLDFDGVGDACDTDADGDGIDDTVDLWPLDTDNDGVDNALDDDDDNDGIADLADPLPFDTDNDSIRNSLDFDDDDDGIGDDDEAASGTDPLNPRHFPTSGTLLWGSGGMAKYAALHDFGSAVDLPRAGVGAASNLRFASGGRAVLLLDGEPGTTTRAEYVPLAGVPATWELGTTVMAVDVVSATADTLGEVVVVHPRQSDAAQTELSRLILAGGSLVPLVSVLSEFDSPDFSGGEVAFIAQPTGCSDCSAAYLISINGQIPRIVAPMVSNPTTIRYNGGAITLLGDASDGIGTSAWLGDMSDPVELRPPGTVDVTGAVGFVDGFAVVAATSATGSGIWLWNGSKARWLKLADTSEPVTELDWSR